MKLETFCQRYTGNTENQKRMELNPCFDLIGLNGQKESNMQHNFNPITCGRRCGVVTENRLTKESKMMRKVNKTISEENKEFFEKNIEIKDIEKAVKSLQNKSPGNDGLTVKFCETFMDILKEDLKELYGEISEKGRMSDSMRQAMITRICKKGDVSLVFSLVIHLFRSYCLLSTK